MEWQAPGVRKWGTPHQRDDLFQSYPCGSNCTTHAVKDLNHTLDIDSYHQDGEDKVKQLGNGSNEVAGSTLGLDRTQKLGGFDQSSSAQSNHKIISPKMDSRDQHQEEGTLCEESTCGTTRGMSKAGAFGTIRSQLSIRSRPVGGFSNILLTSRRRYIDWFHDSYTF